MGTQLAPILSSKEISINELSGKCLVVDSYNMLYQFLTTIRQQDGSLLTDSKGRITSHLSGLFFRTTKFMRNNIKLAFVFDGKSPELKKEEQKRRSNIKNEAQRKYELAVLEGDLELMKKYASRTSRLTEEMINEAKILINSLGLPVIQAPSEGEAQAAHMVSKGQFYALVSQDTDGLLFGSTRVVKNLSISGKRKNKAGYDTISPEIIDLAENLNNLGIDIDQLIVVAMLCGTDFNISGIKGIGPKKALDLIKRHKKDFDAIFNEVNWDGSFQFGWKSVFDTIKNIPVTDDYSLNWKGIDKNSIISLMVKEHDFSQERIENPLNELMKNNSQKGLGDFF